MTSSRVVIVTTNHHPTVCGVGDHSMRAAAELRRRGLDAHVLAVGPAQPHPQAPDVPVHSVRSLPGVLSGAAVAEALFSLQPTHVWLQYVAQLWHGSRLGQPWVVPVAAALRASRIPTLLVAHELYLPWRSRPDLWAGALATRAQLAALLRLVSGCAVSTHARREAVAALARWVRAPYTVTLVPIAPNALPVPQAPHPDGFHVGSFSTLAGGKKVEMLLEAFAMVRARIPAAQLWLIGDLGGGRRRAALDALLDAHPAREAIHLTGRLDLPSVARAVAGLHVFVFPHDVGATTRSGTLPVALGSGVPVVAWRGPDTGPWFVDGVNMAMAQSDSAAHVADAVQRLHDNKALATQVGAGGRALYQQRLDWPPVVNGLLGAAGMHPDQAAR